VAVVKKKPAVRKAAAKSRAAASPKKSAPPGKAAPKKAPLSKKAAPPKKIVAAKKSAPSKKAVPAKKQPPVLDVSGFPSESVRSYEKTICLACVLDVFTRHLNMALRTAWLEIRRYEPPVAEMQEEAFERPYFRGEGSCPYCGAPPKWQARLRIARVESGKATDAVRRSLVKSLPSSEGQFLVLEEKATQQHAFFEWLDKISAEFDLDEPVWLRDASLHYLSRIEPKTDWNEAFRGVHAIRRSRRITEGWENDAGRLFLAPMLFDELLLVQYLVSRSQKAGGLTLEGRYTLPELFVRLRNSGYLRHAGVEGLSPSDTLEALLERLSGGEGSLKFYYLVDRREYVEKAKALKETKAPRPKRPAA
jgi:hypothetical protein